MEPKKPYKERNEEELQEMWEEIAWLLSRPKSQRPTNVKIYETYGIPDTTFYWKIRKPEFARRIVEISLNEAKFWMPELIGVLKEKALVDKSEKSIEMTFKYVADVMEKLDITSKGEKLETLTLTPEQRKRIAQEELED